MSKRLTEQERLDHEAKKLADMWITVSISRNSAGIRNPIMDELEAALGSTPTASDDEREALATLINEAVYKHLRIVDLTDEQQDDLYAVVDAVLAAGFRRSPVPADTPSERPWSESAWRKSDFVLVPSAEHTQMMDARPTPPEDVAALIKLAREHIESECDDADLIGRLAAALAARTLPEGDDVVLSVRPNPPTPSDAELLVIYESACALPIPGLAAVWRHGCDAGMVAP